jgi:uncharacterized protein (DUF1015 family)
MNIQPFKAVRPQVALAAIVASPPYDVLNSSEARVITDANNKSFLRVTKSEVDLPNDIDTHSEIVYTTAAANLQEFIANGTLIQDSTACYYIYELTMNGRTQTGLVCGSSVADYNANKIKKHEYTRPEKEKDRIDHMLAIKAQTGNVFLAYKDVTEMNELVAAIKQADATYNFVATDNITHKVWVVKDATQVNAITNIFANKVPNTYIADGHHRAASAAKTSTAMPDSAAAQFFLTTIFPASELAIIDYNRVVKDLNGYTKDEILEKLAEDFTITTAAEMVKPTALHQIGMYLQNQWYSLQAKPHTYTNDPIGVLDVTILQEKVLDKILGIKDVRTDNRIDFVGGIRGIGELEKRVNSGEMAVAFSLYPVTIEQLFDIADSGNVMPPKSTWFEPKLRDGLLTHILDN